jgi:hypothetical protein
VFDGTNVIVFNFTSTRSGSNTIPSCMQFRTFHPSKKRNAAQHSNTLTDRRKYLTGSKKDLKVNNAIITKADKGNSIVMLYEANYN